MGTSVATSGAVTTRDAGSSVATGPEVLVVDDDDDLRELYAEVLRAGGYAVVEAASGEDAITRLASFRPQVVVTDLSMPGMSGMELAEHFRRDDYPPPAPPVIVVSGFAVAEHEILSRGAAAFLAKPFDPEHLVATVRAVLRGARPQLEGAASTTATRRATARAMAEAAFEAGYTKDPEIERNARRLAAWVGGFFRPALGALLLPRGGELRISLSSERDELTPASAPPELVYVARNVLETGCAMIVPDLAMQPWLGVEHGTFRFVAGVPFRYQELPVGVIVLAAHAPLQIGAPDVAILEHLAAKASARIAGTARLLGRSGLIARESFAWILEVEAGVVNRRRESVGLLLLRTRAPLEASLGDLLERLPAGRFQLGELRPDVVGVSVRAPADALRRALATGAAIVRARVDVVASSEVVVSAPAPVGAGRVMLEWAELLLNETAGAPEGAHVSIVARPTWNGHTAPVTARPRA